MNIKSFRSHYDPGVDSASNRNEFQEHFLGVKAVGVYSWQPYHHPIPLSWNLGTLASRIPLSHSRPVMGLIFYVFRWFVWFVKVLILFCIWATRQNTSLLEGEVFSCRSSDSCCKPLDTGHCVLPRVQYTTRSHNLKPPLLVLVRSNHKKHPSSPSATHPPCTCTRAIQFPNQWIGKKVTS